MGTVIAHIGFPKTGSSFLQGKVFPFIDDIHYLDAASLKSMFFDIIEKDDSFYDPEETGMYLASHFDGSKTVLFSHEPLTGHHYKTAFPNRTQIARRLKTVGVEKIIITIRNQYDILESTYRQYIKSGGVLKPETYFDFHDRGMPYFHLNYYNYSKIYQIYTDIFGSEKICVLQSEDIFSKPVETGKLLTDFLEIESTVDIQNRELVNISLTGRNTAILRVINHFTYNVFRPSHLLSKKISTSLFYRLLHYLQRSPPAKKSYLISEWKKHILDYYKESNVAFQSQSKVLLNDKYFQNSNY